MSYNQVITHVADTVAFIAELEALAPSYVITNEETGKKSWTIQHTPLVRNENGSLAMSIASDEELAFIGSMTTIKSLGTYEDILANPDSLALYKSVYDYETPLTYTDENGAMYHYDRPFKIGEFAR